MQLAPWNFVCSFIATISGRIFLGLLNFQILGHFWNFLKKKLSFFTADAYHVHHISASVTATVFEFCMRLHDNIWTRFSWIFEFPIFWPIFEFSKTLCFFTADAYKVHHISAAFYWLGPSNFSCASLQQYLDQYLFLGFSIFHCMTTFQITHSFWQPTRI